MSKLADAIAIILEDTDLDHHRQDSSDGTTFTLTMQGDHCHFETWVTIYEDTQRVLVASNYPSLGPAERAPEIVEYLMRVNAGLILGAFDFDFDGGTVRFRTAVDVEGVSHEAPLTALFKNMFFTNIINADRYFSGLSKVLDSGLTPADAVALIREAH